MDILERLNKAQEWMRLPDGTDYFTFSNLSDWLNERPVMAFKEAADEIERLRKALLEIENHTIAMMTSSRNYVEKVYDTAFFARSVSMQKDSE